MKYTIEYKEFPTNKAPKGLLIKRSLPKGIVVIKIEIEDETIEIPIVNVWLKEQAETALHKIDQATYYKFTRDLYQVLQMIKDSKIIPNTISPQDERIRIGFGKLIGDDVEGKLQRKLIIEFLEFLTKRLDKK